MPMDLGIFCVIILLLHIRVNHLSSDRHLRRLHDDIILHTTRERAIMRSRCKDAIARRHAIGILTIRERIPVERVQAYITCGGVSIVHLTGLVRVVGASEGHEGVEDGELKAQFDAVEGAFEGDLNLIEVGVFHAQEGDVHEDDEDVDVDEVEHDLARAFLLEARAGL
jgi:hypothetical protein